MIFTRREAVRIRGGRKTQHRFPRSRSAPTPLASLPVSVREANPARGYDAEGQPRVDCLRYCRVQVLSVAPSTLFAATERDAQIEGYRSRDHLLEEWGRGGDVDVWVMRFRLDTDTGRRFLSQRVVAGTQGDYVDNPARSLRDEPEAVDEDTLSVYALRNRERHEEHRAGERDAVLALDFDSRLRVLVNEARARHVDIRDELRAIQRWTEPVARERQLERIQGKLSYPLHAVAS